MFRSQISYLTRTGISRRELLSKKTQGNVEADELLRFFDNLPRFPFFGRLRATLACRGFAVEDLLARGSYSEILHGLLGADGLGYGSAPKGLIPFHAYPDGSRTAFEEHLFEAAAYVRDREGIVRIHFTVPPGEEARVQQHLSSAAARHQDAGTSYAVSVSAQNRSTDTIAVGCDNSLVRDEQGRLLFWPAGHGTLLKNLNDLHGDIIFIRTIDNVLPDRLKGTVAFFKRVLGGLLVMLQERIFQALDALGADSVDEKGLRDIEEWGEASLNFRFPHERQNPAGVERTRILYELLNRPLRVCAMVRHEGEPGGGPFWVENMDGGESLQIVESAQVDMASEPQREIWESSAYFNPADIVCGVRDRHGEPFDLSAYVDASARFVSVKWHKKSRIRILERPGLWNGSMAFWNTVFVEVPKATLHPVKNVMDLLGPEHQV
jgi:hypothetical protein